MGVVHVGVVRVGVICVGVVCVGVEDAHVSVVGGVRTRMWGVKITLSAEIK